MNRIIMVFNFILAVYKFLRKGCARVHPKVRETRLSTCTCCLYLKNHRCWVCGCWVALKSWCIDEDCPKGYWAKPKYKPTSALSQRSSAGKK